MNEARISNQGATEILNHQEHISDVRALLIEQLRTLKAAPLDKLAEEIKRARSMSELGQVIVNSGKVEVEYIEAVKGASESKFLQEKEQDQAPQVPTTPQTPLPSGDPLTRNWPPEQPPLAEWHNPGLIGSAVSLAALREWFRTPVVHGGHCVDGRHQRLGISPSAVRWSRSPRRSHRIRLLKEDAMPSATYNLIRQAIQQKQCIEADYDGYHRQMAPHTLGLSKSGAEQALFYQFGGQSSSGLMPDGHPKNWRCIPLSGLSNVSIINAGWHSASNHSRPQTCVARVDVEVA